MLLCLASFHLNGQCTSCDHTYSGGNFNINANNGQTVCIAANLSSNVNLSNGVTYCIQNGVTWTANNGFNWPGNVTIDVNGGTLVLNGNNNFNGGGNVINTGGSGTLNYGVTNASFNGNLIINNAGNLNFTAPGQQFITRINLNNTGTVTKNSGKLFLDKGTITNDGTFNVSGDLENQEMDTFTNNGTLAVGGEYYSHGKFVNNGTTDIDGGLRVGDKGPGDFLNNNLITVDGGLQFQGSGNIQNNGGIDIITGNLTGGGTITGDGSGNNYVNVVAGNTTNYTGTATNNQIISTNSPPAALPVKVYNFNGVAIDDYNQISWQAADAVGFSHFELQKSSDAKNFESMHRLEALDLNETGGSQFYEFKDTSPIEGQNYYRLLMKDLDGSYAYSSIISVFFEFGAEYIYFQNPTQGQQILLKTNIRKPVIEIIDNLGREVKYKMTKGDSYWRIIPKTYHYEVLILRVRGNKKIFSKRVILN